MAAEIGIIGTGAMGCLFGGYLSRRADVTLLTHRKQQAQAIEETGLSIQTDEGPVACGSLRAVCAAEASEVFDLLVVFVKAFQTRDAIESIRGCIGPETVILTLQNGIGNGQTLQQLFRPEQILVGTSTINSQRLSDTAVSQHGGMGITTIGTVSAARRRSPSRRQRFSPAAASAPRPARILTV
ncbi:MAG: 2-dehydropantoate 2-reductase N-terminal domain-containing protein [Oscillospiraceae bacterium]